MCGGSRCLLLVAFAASKVGRILCCAHQEGGKAYYSCAFKPRPACGLRQPSADSSVVNTAEAEVFLDFARNQRHGVVSTGGYRHGQAQVHAMTNAHAWCCRSSPVYVPPFLYPSSYTLAYCEMLHFDRSLGAFSPLTISRQQEGVWNENKQLRDQVRMLLFCC